MQQFKEDLDIKILKFMGVPKSRQTRHHKSMRRMHIALKAPQFSICGNCKEKVLPHSICLSCGYYKGRKVLDIKKPKKEKHH